MRYLITSWYVAAFAEEVPPGAALGRTIFGESLVLFRTEAGVMSALEGLCPHRFAPLAAGKVEGDAIQCAYHGLRFGLDGICVHNPQGAGHIPRTASRRRFPVAERDGLVWIWMGNAEDADSAKIPDYSLISDGPAASSFHGYVRAAANYELMTDNIMDLSHADFLHPGTLATHEEVTRLRPELSEIDGGIQVSWNWGPAAPPPIFAPLLPPGTKCNTSLQATWRPAANMMIRFACQPPGAEEPLEVRGCHLMTPEDENTTHYFFLGGRSFLQENEEYTRIAKEQIMYAFGEEDKPIIEAVQRGMRGRDLWSMKPVFLPGDAGAVRVRRALAALIEAQPDAEVQSIAG